MTPGWLGSYVRSLSVFSFCLVITATMIALSLSSLPFGNQMFQVGSKMGYDVNAIIAFFVLGYCDLTSHYEGDRRRGFDWVIVGVATTLY